MRALGIAAIAYVAIVAPAAAIEPETNKQLYRSYIEETWNKRNPAAADRYLAPNLIEHNPRLPSGLAGRKQFIASVLAGFSDYHGDVQEVVADGDMVVARVLWTGTQDGPFLGRPATGNKLRFFTADFFRIENGKLAEHWDVVDSLPRAIALGLATAVSPAAATTAPKSP
jgi:predicted ester cyclase